MKEEGNARPSGAIRGTWCLETKYTFYIIVIHKRNVQHNIHVHVSWMIKVMYVVSMKLKLCETHVGHGIRVHQ